MVDWKEKMQAFRIRTLESLDHLNENDDTLSDKINDLYDEYNKYKVCIERRISTLESEYKAIKWMLGIILALLSTIIALIVKFGSGL